MSILSFCQWLQFTPFFTALRGSWYVYPVVMSCHLTAIALFGGMILMTDLRLLGIAMRQRSLADVAGQLRILKRVGFLFVATFGFLMFGSKAEEYYYNAFFRMKLTLFVLIAIHALVFRPTVYNKLAELDKLPRVPGRAKLAAALSLVLWTCVAIAGRGIGYIEPPLDKIHAGLHAPSARVNSPWASSVSGQ
jgi:hypothetical protein